MSPDDCGYVSPEQQARQRIDEMLERAGWVVQDYKAVNLYAGLGVAVRKLPTAVGPCRLTEPGRLTLTADSGAPLPEAMSRRTEPTHTANSPVLASATVEVR